LAKDVKAGPGGRSASYRMEDLDEPAELRRLEAQVRLAAPLELPFLAEAGLRTDHHLLDVGCGPGFFAEQAAADLVPSGRVTGVDVDPGLLALARARLAKNGMAVQFSEGGAAALPLPDDSVDFSYARFLMQHLPQPEAVLAEMVRVTRPGGVVAVVDTDDGGLLVHPAPDGFEELLSASAAAQKDRGGDRLIGRRFKELLLGAGLTEVAASVQTFTSEAVGAEAFLAVTIGFKAGVLGPPHISEAALARAEASLERVSRAPGFLGVALGFGAHGTVGPKP